MENPIHSFRETNLVLQLLYQLQIKSKFVISWSSQKKKRGHFLYRLFYPKGVDNTHIAGIYIHSCDYLNKISIKTNVATDEGNSRNEMRH